MQLADWTRLFAISLVWGSAFFLIEIALRDTGPLTLVTARLALGAVVLLAYCAIAGIRTSLTPSLLAGVAFLGLFGNALPFSFIALGQTQINSSLTAILIATTPLFTVIVGHLWKREEPATWSKFSGVLAGFCGVIILMNPTVLSSFKSGVAGQAAILGAAFSYAIAAVFGRRFRDIPAPATAAGMLTTSSLIMIPFTLAFETPFAMVPSPATLAAIGVLGLLSTALAYILYFTVLKNAGATNAMLVTIVQPPLAILLGVAFLGERLEPNQLFGLGFILAGLLLVDGRIVRRATGRA